VSLCGRRHSATTRSAAAFHLYKTGTAPLWQFGHSAFLEEFLSLGRKHELLATLTTHEHLQFRVSNHNDDNFLPACRTLRFAAVVETPKTEREPASAREL
jgi:hypothetical protein